MNTKLILAKNVSGLRKWKGWSQMELAQKSGVGQGTVSNIENPEKDPNYSTTTNSIDMIAKAFRVHPALLQMDIDLELIKNHGLDNLIRNYSASNHAGRENMQRVAEQEARYSSIQATNNDT